MKSLSKSENLLGVQANISLSRPVGHVFFRFRFDSLLGICFDYPLGLQFSVPHLVESAVVKDSGSVEFIARMMWNRSTVNQEQILQPVLTYVKASSGSGSGISHMSCSGTAGAIWFAP